MFSWLKGKCCGDGVSGDKPALSRATPIAPPIATPATAGSDDSLPALLHRFEITDDSIVFSVTGFGCTRKKHFYLRVECQQPLTLMIARSTIDRCRARPRQHSFALRFDHLPESIQEQIISGEFRLANPLRALPQSVRDFKAL